MGSLDKPSVPIIDLTKEKLKSPGSSSWVSTCQQVVDALEEYGCFVAIYDKISLQDHEAIFHAAKELFDLPIETKLLNKSMTPFHGYISKMPKLHVYQAFGIENITNLEAIEKFTNVMKPSENYRISRVIYSFSNLLVELDQLVMRLISDGLGIQKHLEPILRSTSYGFKMMKYQKSPEESEINLGVSPHTDKNFMSIVHQHQINGLELKTKDGEWMLVDPPLSHSYFIILGGDGAMAWTNGRIKSPIHRVVMLGNEERYSVGLFTNIKDLNIKVPNELVDEENPLQFKPFDHYEYFDFIFSEEGMKFDTPLKALKAYTGV